MKKSYKQLIKDIQQLTTTANKIRKAEIIRVKKAIKSKMAEYQLGLHDLGAVGAAAYAGARDGIMKSKMVAGKPGSKKSSKDKRSVVKPKYKHPKTGETWSGRGKNPRWLAKELKSGKKLNSFLIK